MDFEEFLWAKGYDESVVVDMLEHIRTFNGELNLLLEMLGSVIIYIHSHIFVLSY